MQVDRDSLPCMKYRCALEKLELHQCVFDFYADVFTLSIDSLLCEHDLCDWLHTRFNGHYEWAIPRHIFLRLLIDARKNPKVITKRIKPQVAS